MSSRHPNSVANGQNSRVLILGLDLGTTSFKIATLAVDEQLDSVNALQLIRNPQSYVVVLENFPGQQQHSLSCVPTCLFYTSKAEPPKWGHEADRFQVEEDFNSDFFVANWKLALHQSSDPTVYRVWERLRWTGKLLGKRGLDAFAEDFARVLFTFLFEDYEDSPIRKHFGARIDSYSHIDVVIAVPPGWPRHEHEMLSNAIARGLGEKRSFRVFRASETECVLRSWMQDPGIHVEVGEVLTLLDLGGGTVCISVFRREATKELAWTHMESHSLSAGSEIVSEEFVKDFKYRLAGVDGVPITSKLVHKARKKFDERKVTVGERLSEKDLFIKVPGLKLDPTKEFVEDKMYFSGERLLGYFQPSQDQILHKLKLVTDRIATEYGTPPKYCITAGAYANNKLFRKRLSDMNHHNMEIIVVSGTADSVARGACLTRLHGNFNQFAGGASKNSIAILTYIELDDAIKWHPDPAVRHFTNDGKQYSPALLWTIRKGDPIRPNHAIVEMGSDQVRNDRRRRTFEQGQDIIFTDTMFISDCEVPQEDAYTVLRFRTADTSLWKQNMSDLRSRGISGKLYEVTWDMKNVKLEQKDGSFAPMRRTDIGIDFDDPRPKGKRRVMYYKFLLHVSSTDIQVSIQSFHTRGREKTLIVAQKQISMADTGGFESAALQEEYDNISAGKGTIEDLAGGSGHNDHSQNSPAASSKSIQNSPLHHEKRLWSNGNIHGLEASPSLDTRPPLVNVSQPQGTAPAAGSKSQRDPKRVALAEYTHSPYSNPMAHQRVLDERGRHAAPQIPEAASRTSSRYRTRSSTPIKSPHQPHQSRNGTTFHESQSPTVPSQDALMRGRLQSSLRTPVVPARKRGFEFDDDEDEDEE